MGIYSGKTILKGGDYGTGAEWCPRKRIVWSGCLEGGGGREARVVSALFQSCSLGGAIDGEGDRRKRLAAVLQDCGHSFQGRRPSG